MHIIESAQTQNKEHTNICISKKLSNGNEAKRKDKNKKQEQQQQHSSATVHLIYRAYNVMFYD